MASLFSKLAGLIPKNISSQTSSFYTALLKEVSSTDNSVAQTKNTLERVKQDVTSLKDKFGDVNDCAYPSTPVIDKYYGIASGAIIIVTPPVYMGHSHIEVYRSEVNNLQTAISAGVYSIENGFFFTDTLDLQTTMYYWVAFRNKCGTLGPFHSNGGGLKIQATPDAEAFVDAFAGFLTGGNTAQELRKRVGYIDVDEGITKTIDKTTTAVAARISEVDTTSPFACYIDGIKNTGISSEAACSSSKGIWRQEFKTATAIAQREADARTGYAIINGQINWEIDFAECSTTAGCIWKRDPSAYLKDTIQVTNYDGTYSSLQQSMSIAQDAIGYGVKLDNRGYISGFGMGNDGSYSDAVFAVDTFAIMSPGVYGSYDSMSEQDKLNKVAFGVSRMRWDYASSKAVYDPNAVQSVFIRSANIIDCNIDAANIKFGIINEAVIPKLTADKISVDEVFVGMKIDSQQKAGNGQPIVSINMQAGNIIIRDNAGNVRVKLGAL